MESPFLILIKPFIEDFKFKMLVRLKINTLNVVWIRHILAISVENKIHIEYGCQAESVPFQPGAGELARELAISRGTTYNYLKSLRKAPKRSHL